MQPLDQLARKRRLGVARLHRQHRIQLWPLETRHQAQIFLDERVGDRHRLAVNLLGRLGEADVVTQRLPHLHGAVRAFEQWEDRDVLRLLPICLLDLAAEQQVEQLVGATDLDVGVDCD